MQAIAKQSIIAHNSISVTHKDYDSLWNYDELGENICLKCHSNYFYSQYIYKKHLLNTLSKLQSLH